MIWRERKEHTKSATRPFNDVIISFSLLVMKDGVSIVGSELLIQGISRVVLRAEKMSVRPGPLLVVALHPLGDVLLVHLDVPVSVRAILLVGESLELEFSICANILPLT